jgi:pyruvate/2-oxoglutarate dehydrogenase complex dihydrolipoamide dehydrogenase (E3) component
MANTESLNLKAGGIDVTEQGFIRVDDTLHTSADDVWAMGDCAGSPLFTHVAYENFGWFEITWQARLGRQSGG